MVRKLDCPFKIPDKSSIAILWNPSTGITSEVYLYGFGYVSGSRPRTTTKSSSRLRSNSWKRIWSLLVESTIDALGALLHEALRWLARIGYHPDEDDEEEEEPDGGGQWITLCRFFLLESGAVIVKRRNEVIKPDREEEKLQASSIAVELETGLRLR